MTITTLGDLATQFMLRQPNVSLRSEMQRLSTELATGETADPIRHLGGDLRAFADLEQRLTGNAAFRQAALEASTVTDAMQSALGNLQDMATDLSADLVSLAEAAQPETSQLGAKTAQDTFGRVVGVLNTRVAGRSLFAGAAVGQSALADSEAILADIRSAVVGMTSVADIRAALDDWFEMPGGGFETVGYTGAGDSAPPYQVAQGEMAQLDLRADQLVFRETLKLVAFAALADDPSLGVATRQQIYAAAGTELLSVQGGITSARAELGVAQSRLEETTVRLASESLALEQARGALLGVDPYETATRLESVQSNLENLYTVTVRLSRLSLTEFM
ncbi:flagellar biosynthesis protein FlgL [Lutimaribacter sp. EGI FJ00015]|uniref:Flagellar biosynthesis protein FlgL n=1 Tax=Lutimaribacter degradans TaxID=2945989 RepID=A0ACC5ZUF0_9RHOB|nr:flagellin [Lutimaribacter sp. EGI FJ00013]MCM2561917.1 flagellar biosynthesis protein FlgL [Lutimaribacter sp. EGI FJ00013]MCO0613051.1 flagellar biosynthesis protein FlgL [Lutimaribacter sp. EGI FJ00015]MCO0635749.1 flagellar biosynthesis protein FlgL [Lutimaribacter sp. EGI FJ00014]